MAVCRGGHYAADSGIVPDRPLEETAMAARSAPTTTTATTLVDQRDSLRSPRRQEVWIETISGEVVSASTIDVSEGGLGLIGVGVPVQIGDVIRICLARSSAMDEGWIEVEVRWRSAERIGVAIADARGRRALRLALTAR